MRGKYNRLWLNGYIHVCVDIELWLFSIDKPQLTLEKCMIVYVVDSIELCSSNIPLLLTLLYSRDFIETIEVNRNDSTAANRL